MKNLVFLPLLFLVFGCQQNSTQQQASTTPETEKPTINEGFYNLFEEVNVVKMHVFAINDTNAGGENYPYVGKAVPAEMAQYLPTDLQPQGVFACYRTENSGHFILRATSEANANELLLCKWDEGAGKLEKITNLASLQCSEGTCSQKDSWLTDLDDNRTLELVTRSHKRDAQGNLSEETFEVTTDDGSGHFNKTDEQLASLAVKSNYVMQ